MVIDGSRLDLKHTKEDLYRYNFFSSDFCQIYQSSNLIFFPWKCCMEDCSSFLLLLACQDGCNFSSFVVAVCDVPFVGLDGAVLLWVR